MRYFASLLFLLLFFVSAPAQPNHGEHYAKRIAQFNAEKPITRKDIVFLGNSLTEGGNWSALFPKISAKLAKKNARFVNRGIIGDDAPGIFDRLYQIIPYQPAKIFLLVGVNDISHHLKVDSIANAIFKIVYEIRAKSPETKLYIQTLLPINESFKRYKNLNGKTHAVAELNEIIKRRAKKERVCCVDLNPNFGSKANSEVLDTSITTDGLHLNSDGYKIWAKLLKKYMKL